MTMTPLGLEPKPNSGSKRSRYPDVRIKASFFNSVGRQIDAEADSHGSSTGRFSSDVVQCATSKAISNPIGNFSLSLVPRRDYLTDVTPGCWCKIQGDNGDGQGMRDMLYGPVKSVRRRRAVTDRGVTRTMFTVAGSDFGEVLSRTSAIYDARLASVAAINQLGYTALSTPMTRAQQVSANPGVIVQSILQHYLCNTIPQLFDPQTNQPFGLGLNVTDYINTTSTLGQAALNTISPAESLWQLLQQWANLGVNELFADYRLPIGSSSNNTTLVPAVVLRQCPFWGQDWEALPLCRVDSDECMEDDIGTSDEDVRNWIRPQDEQGIATSVANLGIVNQESINTFGFRRYETPVQYAVNPQLRGLAIPGIIEATAGLQALWHHSNELLLSGSMNLYFRPEIRVGYRVAFRERDIDKTFEYYVEAVSHNFSYPGVNTTSLTVTRGRDTDDPLWRRSLYDLKNRGILTPMGNTIDTTLNYAIQGLSR